MTPSTIRWRLGCDPCGNRCNPAQHLPDSTQYAYILTDSRVTALVAAAPLAQSIWPAIARLPHLKTVILIGEKEQAALPGCNTQLFEDMLANASDEPLTADTVSDEVAFWLYTSGSTGDPKGVKHVHTSLMVTAKLFGQGILGISENDVVHSASSCFFAYGLGNAMTFRFSRHRRTMAVSAVAGGCVRDGRAIRATIFYGVPSLYTALLADKNICKGAGSDRLRLCVSAGEALPAHIGEHWRDTSVSMCSTASCQPNCCRPSCPTGPATFATVPPASRYPVTTPRSSTRTGANSVWTRSAN